MAPNTSQMLINEDRTPNADENEDSAHTFLDLGTNTLVKCSMPVVPGAAPAPQSSPKKSKKASAGGGDEEGKPEPKFRYVFKNSQNVLG